MKSPAVEIPLPHPARGKTFKASIGGHAVYLRTGEYEDGALGEAFLDARHEPVGPRSLLNLLSVAVSIGLRHGVPLEKYVNAFLFARFEPNGVVAGSPRVRMSTSIPDYVFRELAIHYLGRDDLTHGESEAASA